MPTKTKIDIEKKYNLQKKFQQVLPKIKQINDVALYQNKYSQILSLNTLRNNFIHLKTTDLKNELVPIVNDIEKILKLDIDNEYSKIEKFIEMITQYQNVS